MKPPFQTANFTVDPIAGSVTGPQGNICKIRPRTFELLLFLVSAENKVVSKSEILEKVWSDVVVGEHVVFQSINEIRQVFSPSNVIKTIPKQGYAWTMPVTSVSKPILQNRGSEQTSNRPKRIIQTLLFSFCVVLLFILIWANKQPDAYISGSIVVLPVNNQIDDSDHGWLSLGAMDQLIQQLASNKNSGVLHTDYVLEVMQRANAPAYGYRQSDIDKLFVVSGASLIVELAFSGTPQDYQLLYTLHRPHGSNKGVLFSSRIADAIDQLAKRISKTGGLKLNELGTDYHSDFANELIANALEAKRDNKHEFASQLLQSAIISEPHNLTAQRLLLQIVIEQGDIENSSLLSNSLLQQISTYETPHREHIRILFWSAVNLIIQKKFEAAEPLLEEVDALSSTLNDWLYLAYLAELRGQIAQFHQEFENAEALYTEAINFHKVLHCPFGESNGLLNLSMLEKERGNTQKAEIHINKALTLIRKRQLSELEVRAVSWQKQLLQ
ncbi:winged helix-turn-helix domain-containing protein [Glaciecola sp. 2405UD65-10]|uniref:winged helix-turn-helix domain-containing protein n=1 Tax=Glaciecola sp. 2405UD65-10 TaxID=3397244 RepID=UPI003B59B9E8